MLEVSNYLSIVILIILSICETFCFIKLRCCKHMDRSALLILMAYLAIFVLKVSQNIFFKDAGGSVGIQQALNIVIQVTLMYFISEMSEVNMKLISDSNIDYMGRVKALYKIKIWVILGTCYWIGLFIVN